jgi:hypothetical protein
MNFRALQRQQRDIKLPSPTASLRTSLSAAVVTHEAHLRLHEAKDPHWYTKSGRISVDRSALQVRSDPN